MTNTQILTNIIVIFSSIVSMVCVIYIALDVNETWFYITGLIVCITNMLIAAVGIYDIINDDKEDEKKKREND